MEQGIDHLVSLSPEKIPPHYAFPNLQHTLIPVEDFTGPTIAEIQKFLEICDCARRDGEVFENFEIFLRIYTEYFVGRGRSLRRGAWPDGRHVRVLSDILLRHGALGRHPDHEAAAARERREEGAGGDRGQVLPAADRLRQGEYR